jgi:hypothetical protein
MQLSTTDSSELTAREIFRINLEFFQGAYPKRNIRMEGSLVYIDGGCKFNIEGYNLLYNLQRLVKCLEDELL